MRNKFISSMVFTLFLLGVCFQSFAQKELYSKTDNKWGYFNNHVFNLQKNGYLWLERTTEIGTVPKYVLHHFNSKMEKLKEFTITDELRHYQGIVFDQNSDTPSDVYLIGVPDGGVMGTKINSRKTKRKIFHLNLQNGETSITPIETDGYVDDFFCVGDLIYFTTFRDAKKTHANAEFASPGGDFFISVYDTKKKSITTEAKLPIPGLYKKSTGVYNRLLRVENGIAFFTTQIAEEESKGSVVYKLSFYELELSSFKMKNEKLVTFNWDKKYIRSMACFYDPASKAYYSYGNYTQKSSMSYIGLGEGSFFIRVNEDYSLAYSRANQGKLLDSEYLYMYVDRNREKRHSSFGNEIYIKSTDHDVDAYVFNKHDGAVKSVIGVGVKKMNYSSDIDYLALCEKNTKLKSFLDSFISKKLVKTSDNSFVYATENNEDKNSLYLFVSDRLNTVKIFSIEK